MGGAALFLLIRALPFPFPGLILFAKLLGTASFVLPLVGYPPFIDIFSGETLISPDPVLFPFVGLLYSWPPFHLGDVGFLSYASFSA